MPLGKENCEYVERMNECTDVDERTMAVFLLERLQAWSKGPPQKTRNDAGEVGGGAARERRRWGRRSPSARRPSRPPPRSARTARTWPRSTPSRRAARLGAQASQHGRRSARQGGPGDLEQALRVLNNLTKELGEFLHTNHLVALTATGPRSCAPSMPRRATRSSGPRSSSQRANEAREAKKRARLCAPMPAIYEATTAAPPIPCNPCCTPPSRRRHRRHPQPGAGKARASPVSSPEDASPPATLPAVAPAAVPALSKGQEGAQGQGQGGGGAAAALLVGAGEVPAGANSARDSCRPAAREAERARARDRREGGARSSSRWLSMLDVVVGIGRLGAGGRRCSWAPHVFATTAPAAARSGSSTCWRWLPRSTRARPAADAGDRLGGADGRGERRRRGLGRLGEHGRLGR